MRYEPRNYTLDAEHGLAPDWLEKFPMVTPFARNCIVGLAIALALIAFAIIH